MNNLELLIVGNVIKSRERFNPKEWDYFHQSIEQINKQFRSSLKIPLIVYSGDSFGGTCDNLNTAIKIVMAIQEYQKYQKSRMVIIEDQVTFGLEKNNFLALEGPALWKSQNNLEKLRKTPSFFLADLQDKIKTAAVNTILNLVLAIRNDWNEIEWEVYKSIGRGIKQKELAVQLGVSQQYISKIMNRSKLKAVKQAEDNLELIINGINSRVYRK